MMRGRKNKDGLLINTSNWTRVTCNCQILKFENMDEDGFYVEFYFYNKLSSLRPADMSDPSVKHVRGTRFGSIRRETCMILRGNLLPHLASHSANCFMHLANRYRHSANCCMHSASGCRHQS
jgi:hypothetical protein